MPEIEVGNTKIHYEVHGHGDPVVCLGGWGSFCRDELTHLPWGLVDRYKVIVVDYRGIGDSADDVSLAPSINLYANDVCAVLDHLNIPNAHLLGMVGIGGCITQQICINRPDLARSLINTGSWCTVDRHLKDHLELFLDVHENMGFLAFQRLVSIMSFSEEFYNGNIDRLLGEDGVWHHLNGNLISHQRFIDASLKHEVVDELRKVETPALIVHSPLDTVTGPRTTIPIEKAMPNAQGYTLEGAAHVIAGKKLKQKFSNLINEFYSQF